MNTIKQLADQCWQYTAEPLYSERSAHWEFDHHKFAQLIVKECAPFVGDLDSTAVKEFFNHFGVEP